MSLFRISGFCAIGAALSYGAAILRGDFMCASTLTAIFIGLFALSGLFAIAFLIAGFIRQAFRTRKVES